MTSMQARRPLETVAEARVIDAIENLHIQLREGQQRGAAGVRQRQAEALDRLDLRIGGGRYLDEFGDAIAWRPVQ